MILFLNCIADPAVRSRFDARIVPRLAALAGAPFAVAHLFGAGPRPGPADASHLVITGSELSAARDHPHDAELCRTIRDFVEAGRPVLGICYGHQMLARAFGGACRRAERPEFGWKAVDLRPSPIFAGIDSLVTAHSHYDEVDRLPAEFEVLASTDRCEVQAFRYGGAHVYGVQFHPEMTREDGQRMFAENVEADPAIARHLTDDLPDPSLLAANDRIFTNFFAAGRSAGNDRDCHGTREGRSAT